MSNYILKQLNDKEFNIFKQFVKYDFTGITIHKNIIMFIPRHKSNKMFIHDNSVIYCLNNCESPKVNDIIGISFDKFVNKNYNLTQIDFRSKGDAWGTNRWLECKLNNNKTINKLFHDTIMTKLQNAYILLKQMIDFKDINQYIIKMYANIIL